MSLLTQASLVVTPNGVKEGKLYSVIPSDGSGDMSVVRATTATRVNSAGLVELVPYNLLSYSEQFDNAYWLKIPTGSATVSVSANSTTAPNGTLTADLVTLTRSSITELSAIIANTAAPLGTYKNSIWIKAKDLSNVGKTIDLWSWEGTTRGYTMITLTAEWVRYEQATTVFSVTATNELFDFGLLPSSFSTSTTTAVEFYVWGGQSVEGTLPKDYQKTETRLNIPRLDYSNGTCPSLLVEPQRTNLALYSEQFDNAAWGVSEATISANVTVAPNGTNTADKLIESNTNALHEVYSSTPFSLTSGIAYTKTIYAKSSERTQISLNFITGGFGQGSSVIANLTTGTLGTVTNYGGVTGSTATITNVNNGWYRISITMTPVTTATFYADFTPALNGAISYQGNGTSGLFIWGAQLEAGSYPTSYIPTTSASVTRNADVISKTGISSLIGQTEGVFYAEFTIPETQSPSFFSISDGSSANRIVFGYYSGALRYYTNSSTGSFSATGIIDASAVVGQVYKIAIAYKANDFVVYKNGVNTNTLTTYTLPSSLTEMDNQGGTGVGQYIYASIKSIALWKTRLTNDQLEQLTGIGFNTYAEMANYYNYTLQ